MHYSIDLPHLPGNAGNRSRSPLPMNAPCVTNQAGIIILSQRRGCPSMTCHVSTQLLSDLQGNIPPAATSSYAAQHPRILPVLVLLGILNNREQIRRIRIHVLVFLYNGHRFPDKPQQLVSSSCAGDKQSRSPVNHIYAGMPSQQKASLEAKTAGQTYRVKKAVQAKAFICHQPTDYLRKPPFSP